MRQPDLFGVCEDLTADSISGTQVHLAENQVERQEAKGIQGLAFVRINLYSQKSLFVSSEGDASNTHSPQAPPCPYSTTF